MTQVQLSVEEALDFQRTNERLEGFTAGIQAATNYILRMKLDSILAARPKPVSQADQSEAPNGSS